MAKVKFVVSTREGNFDTESHFWEKEMETPFLLLGMKVRVAGTLLIPVTEAVVELDGSVRAVLGDLSANICSRELMEQQGWVNTMTFNHETAQVDYHAMEGEA